MVGRGRVGLPSCRHRVVLGVCLLLPLCIVGQALGGYLGRPPSRAWVEDNLYGDVLAYEVWDGVPHVLVRRDDGELQFDHLILDRISIDWPPTPRWQYSGLWYTANDWRMSAVLRVAPCAGVLGEGCGKPVELFGTVASPAIVALEVLVDGAWRRFPIAAPGFVIRLDGRSLPADHRWLDAAGNEVAV
jgi:hypothetical protein